MREQFDDFINNLSEIDRENYLKYKDIRGIQTYKIIYNSLLQEYSEVEYKDVNALVMYDKALKDQLFKFLGTLEDYLHNFILSNYDFEITANLSKKEYKYFKEMPECFKLKNPTSQITELYKRYNLMFGEMILFLEKYDKYRFDLYKLRQIKSLRNMVMHHAPLIFDVNGYPIIQETRQKIIELLIMLPNNYHIGLIASINNLNQKTKNNLDCKAYKFLLEDISNV
ncbi:MAG: hypothetical protein SO253_01040 [Bacilli bacterium]|nr:hypothetical protein [Bacilli bacterium]